MSNNIFLLQQQMQLKPLLYYPNNKFKTQTTFYLLQEQIENANNIYFTATANAKLFGFLRAVFS